MKIHLVDGTYELFRHYHALPPLKDAEDREVAAVRGVLASVLGMVQSGATHVGVATDHVIESFRNAMWPGYKTGEGVPEDLLSQFGLLEEALTAMGVMVWAMTEFEADDALAAAAERAATDPRVEQVLICTPDKDLSQCVRGERVVQVDRRKNVVRDEAGVWGKFGVGPRSIPDYLALVGDTADGFPGLPGWGAKSAAAVLARYERLENIPSRAQDWQVRVSGAPGLSETLEAQRERAMLFREIATLRTEIDLFENVEDLRWRGPADGFELLAAKLDTNVTGEGRRGRRFGCQVTALGGSA